MHILTKEMVIGMARNHDEISFRDMDQKFLLVKDIDMKTRMVIC